MKIYFFNTDNLTQINLKNGYKMLDTLKKARVDRCTNEAQKRNIIASDLLTRTMLSTYLKQEPGSFVFAHSSHGKPILPNGDAYFNISHSNQYWVGCVSDVPCGIDIEIIKEVTLNSAKKFCTQEELNYISSNPLPNVAFLEIWTRKEAYFKSIGCGIATVLSSVNVLKEDKLATKIFNNYIISVYCDTPNLEIENLTI